VLSPRLFAALALFLVLIPISAQQPAKKKATAPAKKAPAAPSADPFAGLALRNIGPALTSGRVVDFAVDPHDRSHYFVAAASGGVWKTINAGTSWSPVFDNEGSYSIGVVVLDPKNPHVVWVGTGENNSQRSVGYGDGVYRSDDSGRSWKNLGLKSSEHIGKILLDPRNSNVVYVAAQGPLWGPGGDRGLYKSTDGGKTWKRILNISKNTGVTDVVLDPRQPDHLLAASYQRRRHVWTLIDGGPESAIHRSTDGGATWTKVTAGLPSADMGRIGLAVAPTNPDIIYATIEAADHKGGIFRSTDRGVTWERRNEFNQGAMYYAHVYVDPKNAERIYIMGVLIQVSDDGGNTVHPLGEPAKHVDNHVIWIDPNDTNYYLVGCDGGIYESFDRAATWRFHGNLPITQFYDIAAGNDAPFYHVYGGTQDNFSLGGPARTRSVHGITNGDWFVTEGGDGFHCRVDPKDPNTVYCEAQYGVLTRFDRKTGESMGIQPQPAPGEPSLRWNWDSPLTISSHQHTRIYFAANKLFRSNDRGNTWKAISGDLSRQIDRNQLPVMGKVWRADAVAKSESTSLYGNITALAESPRDEELLYAGTDDGLIQVTEDGGKKWRKIDKFAGVPERSYVSRLLASHHGEHTVFAAFDNHKNADFAPYLLKSADAGKTWTSLKADLPANGSVLALAEDPADANLLFVGTEFAVFFSNDAGQHWIRLKGGMPTIAVRDLAIQGQMNDLVVGTFGRGIYVLDDYSLLRGLSSEALGKPALLFPVREAQLYIPTRQYGLRGKAFQGASFFTADNPPYGATLTYYLKETIQTSKEKRLAAEKKPTAKGKATPYPRPAELRAEAEEEAPTVQFTIHDSTGTAIRTLTGPVTKGFHRVRWDLREPAPDLPRRRAPGGEADVFSEPSNGALVLPGVYTVTWAQRVAGAVTPLPGRQEIRVVIDTPSEVKPADRQALLAFQQKLTRLRRAVSGALSSANNLESRLEDIKRALDQTPSIADKWRAVARTLEARNREILRRLRGDEELRRRNENTPMSIAERVETIVGEQRLSLDPPTTTHRQQYDAASYALTQELGKLRHIIQVDLPPLEKALNAAGAPWTPGRLPEWSEK
jgi:photosystem II stability/assembly factor-like uncharacterized protein